MPYNRRPPATSDESAASVFAPFQPGVPADAKAKDYADKPLPGSEPAPERTRVGALSSKKLQEAAERDEPPAKPPKRQPTLTSLVAATVRDSYEPATLQPLRDPDAKPKAESKPKAEAKPSTTKDTAAAS